MAVSKSMENNNLPLISSGTWDTEFLEWSRIKLNPDEESYKIPISANYYCIGELVFFNIHVVMTNPLSWGVLEDNTDPDHIRPWRFKLPFKKKDDWDISSLSLDKLSDIGNYSTNFLTGRYVGTIHEGRELGEKIVTAMFGILSFEEYLYIYSLDSQNENLKTYGLKSITSEWPLNFNSYKSADENVDAYSFLRLSISGTYRR